LEKKYPNIKLVSRRNEEYDDQNHAYERRKEFLASFPNLKGILGSSSTSALRISLPSVPPCYCMLHWNPRLPYASSPGAALAAAR
jgi:hypothetical protein